MHEKNVLYFVINNAIPKNRIKLDKNSHVIKTIVPKFHGFIQKDYF